MMLLNETVSDLFICNFIGLCKTVQNVHILLILKGQKKKKNLCLSVYMSEITHPIHMQAYWRNYKVMFCPTRSVPI